ncbi:hypothetical protein DITRI_Ditri20bG0037200 [Diplodiscus trichospermus]
MGKLRNNHCKKSENPMEVKKNPIKVRYISSPKIVKASNAAEFRAIVQELTGQDSDTGEPCNVPTAFPEQADHVHYPFQVDSPAKINDTLPDDMSSLEFDESLPQKICSDFDFLPFLYEF